MKFSFEKKIGAFFFIAAIALLLVLVVFYNDAQKVKSTSDLVEHTQEVLRKSDNVLLDVLNIETGSRGYILTGDKMFLEPYNKALQTINGYLLELTLLTKDNPNQQLRIGLLKKITEERLVYTKNRIETRKSIELKETNKTVLYDKGKILTDKIRSVIADINSEELHLLELRKNENQKENRNSEFMFLSLLIVIVIILVIVTIVILKNQKTRKQTEEQLEFVNKELKEVAEKLEIQNSLLKSTITSYKDILIFSINKEYQYLIFNDAFKLATRQAYGTEVMTGKSILDSITNNNDRKKAKDNCDKALAGEGHVTLEIFGDLTRYYYETRYNPITDDNGQVIGVTVMSANVTERIRAEEHLLELNKELESFSYSVSHDLRAPLRAIDGYAGILEEDYGKILDEEGNRLLGAVQFNAKKMGNLIDDLLTFSRIGKKELTKTTLNMNELVEGALYELNKSVKHRAKVKIGELHSSKGDYGLINQVVINLLSNAIKYSAKVKEPFIEISSEKNDKEIIYTIKDNGAGFDMRYVHKLFGVFQRLHTMDEFEGTGVGLAIVQRIMNKHGGKVWAEGEKNKGATFKFSLPIN